MSCETLEIVWIQGSTGVEVSDVKVDRPRIDTVEKSSGPFQLSDVYFRFSSILGNGVLLCSTATMLSDMSCSDGLDKAQQLGRPVLGKILMTLCLCPAFEFSVHPICGIRIILTRSDVICWDVLRYMYVWGDLAEPIHIIV